MSSSIWTYPVSSAAPAPGSVLALDSTGANIVAAPGMSQIVAASSPPAAGSVLALNSAGAIIIAAPGMPLKVAGGQIDLSTYIQSIPAGTTSSATGFGGNTMLGTDIVVLSPGAGFPSGVVGGLIFVGIPLSIGSGVYQPSILVSNTTSATVTISTGYMVNWMILR
jgi:hypothetical protein